MTGASRQLSLSVGLADAATFATFEPPATPLFLEWLRERSAPRAARSHDRGWLWGATGSGRSHLLQAACHEMVEGGGRAIYLTAAVLGEAPAAVLADLEGFDLVALDDLDRQASDAEAEAALFDLCNRMLERSGLLLCAADAPPLACGWRLPDLASRLAQASVWRVPALDDAGRARALRRRAAVRGIELDARVAAYILAHFPRDSTALFALLDELDDASLAAQRRVTVPFVRELLAARDAS